MKSKLIFVFALLGLFSLTSNVLATDSNTLQPAQVSYDDALHVPSLHVGDTKGGGGVTYFNGTIINASEGDVPVTFGDDVRIDGALFRGSTSGSGDNMPVKILDDLYVSGDITIQGSTSIISGNNTINIPNKSGTVALLSDINNSSNGLWEDGNNGVYEDDKGVIVGTDQAETLSNAGFALNTGDLFVQDKLGVEGGIYTDSSLIVGEGTMYGDGMITTTGSIDLYVDISGDDMNIQDRTIIDIDDDYAFEVRGDGDGNDALVVNTNASQVGIGTVPSYRLHVADIGLEGTGFQRMSHFVDTNISSGTQSDASFGVLGQQTISGDAAHSGGPADPAVGVQGSLFQASTGTITEGYGSAGLFLTLGGGTGDVLLAAGTIGVVINLTAAEITDAVALYARANGIYGTGTGTITNSYGLRVDDQTFGNNNWAIQTGAGTVEFNDHQIIDTDNSEALLIRKDGDAEDVLVVDTISGEVGIGTSDPETKLEVM